MLPAAADSAAADAGRLARCAPQGGVPCVPDCAGLLPRSLSEAAPHTVQAVPAKPIS
jgi:hypothetical protein